MLLELGEAVGARRDGSRGVSLLASLPLQQLLLLQRWHNQGNDAAQKLNQMLFCCWALSEPAQSPRLLGGGAISRLCWHRGAGS